jgi:Na+-transporting NADH:ubiquinone oxidoreductase subunit C
LRDKVHTIIFAAVLGLICSLLLVVANTLTAPYRKANERAEEIKNFLYALNVPVDPGADSKTLLEIFNKNIRVREVGSLSFYEYIPDKELSAEPVAVAVSFSGAGVWGPIKGVIALEPDLITIRGIRFYKQEETPGLGGEIGSEWFQKQFDGKEIVSSRGEPGFNIIRHGDPTDRNSVDAITGATMTSDRVQQILSELSKKLAEVRNDYGG